MTLGLPCGYVTCNSLPITWMRKRSVARLQKDPNQPSAWDLLVKVLFTCSSRINIQSYSFFHTVHPNIRSVSESASSVLYLWFLTQSFNRVIPESLVIRCRYATVGLPRFHLWMKPSRALLPGDKAVMNFQAQSPSLGLVEWIRLLLIPFD